MSDQRFHYYYLEIGLERGVSFIWSSTVLNSRLCIRKLCLKRGVVFHQGYHCIATRFQHVSDLFDSHDDPSLCVPGLVTGAECPGA